MKFIPVNSDNAEAACLWCYEHMGFPSETSLTWEYRRSSRDWLFVVYDPELETLFRLKFQRNDTV